MRHATLTIEIRPCMTLDHLNWYEAFYRGEMIAQTCKPNDTAGVQELEKRALPIMQSKYGVESLLPSRRLPEGIRYDKEATYPHEQF